MSGNVRSVVGAMTRDRASDEDKPDALLRHLLNETRKGNRILEHVLKQSTATLDTIVCEKAVATPGAALGGTTYTGTIPAQTRQVEVIESIYVFAVDTAHALGVNELFVLVDDVYYAVAPTGANGALTGLFQGLHHPVRSDVTRSFTAVMSGPFTDTVHVGAVLMGRAVPTTLGEVLG